MCDIHCAYDSMIVRPGEASPSLWWLRPVFRAWGAGRPGEDGGGEGGEERRGVCDRRDRECAQVHVPAEPPDCTQP